MESESTLERQVGKGVLNAVKKAWTETGENQWNKRPFLFDVKLFRAKLNDNLVREENIARHKICFVCKLKIVMR